MSILIKPNHTLVCLGDSITQDGSGYVSLITSHIAAKYPERDIKVINAGIGGHKAPQMLERLERDVIAHHPDWVTINVGINDVWHGLDNDGVNGVSLEDYTQILTQIVQTLQEKTTARIVLMEPTVISEDPEAAANKTLLGYCDAMRKIADEYDLILCPTHEDFVYTLVAGKQANPDFKMTTDGVHMNSVGAARMALTLLNTLKF